MNSKEFRESQKEKIPKSVLSRLDSIKDSILKYIGKYLIDDSLPRSIFDKIYEKIKTEGEYCEKKPLSIKAMYNPKKESVLIIISLPVVNSPKTIFVVSQSSIYIEEINDNNIKKSGYTASFIIRDGIDKKYGTIEYKRKPEELADSKPVLTDSKKEDPEKEKLEKGILKSLMIQPEEAGSIIDDTLYPNGWKLYSRHYGEMESMIYKPGDIIEFSIFQLPKEDVTIKFHIDLNGKSGIITITDDGKEIDIRKGFS